MPRPEPKGPPHDSHDATEVVRRSRPHRSPSSPAPPPAPTPPSGGGSGDKKQVSVVGFSILKTANKQVIADFQKTDAGKDVEFKESYGASGDQARAVIAGLKADEVHLSLEPDMTKLTDENLVDQRLEGGRQQGHPHPVGRGDRRPQGQPQGHQDLGRPDQARRQDRDAEPRLLRLGEVEHPGGVRPRARQGWQRGRRPGLPEEVPRQRRGLPGQRQGRDHRVRGRHR